MWGKSTRGPLQLTIDEDGQTRAHDRFTLTAPVAGLLSRTTFHEGDEVAKDTIIAWIHPLPVQTQEKRRKSAHSIATAQALNREAEQQTPPRRSGTSTVLAGSCPGADAL